MNKEEVASKIYDDVKEIIEVSFNNAELSYDTKSKRWRIRAMFGLKKEMKSANIYRLFEGKNFSINTPKLSKVRKFSAIRYYKDDNPS